MCPIAYRPIPKYRCTKLKNTDTDIPVSNLDRYPSLPLGVWDSGCRLIPARGSCTAVGDHTPGLHSYLPGTLMHTGFSRRALTLTLAAAVEQSFCSVCDCRKGFSAIVARHRLHFNPNCVQTFATSHDCSQLIKGPPSRSFRPCHVIELIGIKRKR